MNYWDLVKDAVETTLRNRFLWFFGFFVGGTASVLSRNVPLRGAESGSVALASLVLALAILVVLIFVAMGLISHGALAESVAAVDRGQRRRFSSAFRAGTGSFWRVLGYYVVFILLGLGVLVAILLPVALLVGGAFAATQSAGVRATVTVLGGVLGIVLFVAAFVPLSVVGQYALREVVVRQGRVLDSVLSGYAIFRRNVGRSLVLWLIHFALWVGIFLASAVTYGVLGLILLGPAAALFRADYATAGVIVGAAGGLLFLVPLLAISGALGAFNHAYWTLAYLRLAAPAYRNAGWTGRR